MTVPVYPVNTTAFDSSSSHRNAERVPLPPPLQSPVPSTRKMCPFPAPISCHALAEFFPIFVSVELPATVAVFSLPATIGSLMLNLRAALRLPAPRSRTRAWFCPVPMSPGGCHVSDPHHELFYFPAPVVITTPRRVLRPVFVTVITYGRSGPQRYVARCRDRDRNVRSRPSRLP